ncbi:MAG: 30S ribosome-binding factor RbfA [Bacilli bacterium]
MSIKTQRIASNIVKELSYILSFEVKDSDIKFVTVTDCKLAPDLSFAKVYVTIYDQAKIDSTLDALKDATGFIRRQLANRVDMRHVPNLEFVYDESIDYGKKIENIIEKIHED